MVKTRLMRAADVILLPIPGQRHQFGFSQSELRAHAAMMGTSLHTLVQMVDNGLGVTFVPGMAIQAGILARTRVEALPLLSDHPYRRIALIWRRSSPRETEFLLLATALRRIAADLVPDISPAAAPTPMLEPLDS